MLIPVFGAGCSPYLFPTRPSPGIVGTFTPAAVLPSTPIPEQATTPTSGPFALELTPLPTATALPPLVLPTQPAFPIGIQVWDGLPTYPAESQSDYYFRLQYDPTRWALTENPFGEPVLANRGLSGCVLAPASGRGLPLSGSVDHEVRRIGGVTFQISTAALSGVTKFANYAGGDGIIYTAFAVSFEDQAEACLAAAEQVLGTLRSVPLIEATPITGN